MTASWRSRSFTQHAMPYGNMEAGRRFLNQMPINPDDKEKIAHLNAERLLKL